MQHLDNNLLFFAEFYLNLYRTKPNIYEKNIIIFHYTNVTLLQYFCTIAFNVYGHSHYGKKRSHGNKVKAKGLYRKDAGE